MNRILASIFCLLIFPAAAHAERFAFIGFDGEFWQVFAIGVEGGAPLKVSKSAFDKTRISVDRKNRRLLYATSAGRIFFQGFGAAEEVELDVGLEGMTDAVVSPDGEHVAFSLSTGDSIDNNDIWVFHLKTRKLRKLTNETGLQHHPAWSPDGKKLLFLSGDGDQNHDIFVIDINGSSMSQLTAGGLYHFGEDLSVNEELVFCSNRSGNYDIYSMSLNGRNLRRLTRAPSFEGEPSWSADGARIGYVSTETGKRQLHVINRNGTGKKWIPTSFQVRNPIWLE